jgi:hypothetical protein
MAGVKVPMNFGIYGTARPKVTRNSIIKRKLMLRMQEKNISHAARNKSINSYVRIWYYDQKVHVHFKRKNIYCSIIEIHSVY